MPPFAVEVHPLAAAEAEAAERWYRERNETAATRFRRELARLRRGLDLQWKPHQRSKFTAE